MKKQIIVTMLLAAALGTVSPSMKAEAKWKADAKGRWYTIKLHRLRCWLEADR